MNARKLVVGTIAGAAALGTLASTGGAATSSPPKFVKAPSVTYSIVKTARGKYVSLGAVVRLDRKITDKLRRKYILVASPTLRAGQTLPKELVGGASLGAIGKPSRYCYSTEVSQLKRKTSTHPGSTWGLAFATSKTVVGHVTKVKIKKSSDQSIADASHKLGCD